MNVAVIADMTDSHAPASYRGSQTAEEFLRQIGHVWIGLIETIAAEQDQEAALAGYFGVSPQVIRHWVDARGRTRCIAQRPDGRRCATLVGHTVQYDPKVWAEQEQRCGAHGTAGTRYKG